MKISTELIDVFYNAINSGDNVRKRVYFSKHFVERSFERNVDTLMVVKYIMHHLNDHLCERIYESVLQEGRAIKFRCNSFIVRGKFDEIRRKFVILTVYAYGSSTLLE